MKKKRYFLITSLAAAVLLAFSACSQDEIVGGDDSLLPDGAYPLKIGSVSIVAQRSEEPWTRVAENTTDGASSVWENGDVIGVRLDGDPSYYGENAPIPFTERGEYIINRNDGSLYISPYGDEIYWEYSYAGINSQKTYNGQTWYMGGVTAWYPTDESVELGNQSERLAYILEGHEKTLDNNRSYYPDDEIPLEFKHLLAKVRVELKGERATAINKVEVYSYTSCTHTEVPPTTHTAPYRNISTDGASQGWITMHKATYTDGNTYWEANLVPGEIGGQDTQPFVRLNGTTEVPISTLTELKAGNLHTVTIKVNAYPSDATQITSTTGNISGEGNYYVTGNLASAINITGGSPHIYLYNANVTNSAGSAISITNGAKPTIHVVGTNSLSNTTTTTTNGGAGIFVAAGSSVIIKSTDKNTNSLTVTGYQGAGIGGVAANNRGTGTPCGDITIENVTVTATSKGLYGYSPGIGSSGSATCGTITITNAIVHATGRSTTPLAAPAIGAGMDEFLNRGSIPTIQITDSDIHAHKGNYSDYIGLPGERYGYNGGAIQFGTNGYCRNSTIYCYTGSSSTPDKTVVYDVNGIGTEQSQ